MPSNPKDPVSPSNNDSEKEKYRKALVEQLEIIKEWGKLSINEQPVCVVYFVEKIGELFLEYYQDHLDEAQQHAKPYQNLLKEHYDFIEEYYVNEIASNIICADFEWDDPWNRACLYWTNLEAFNAMFEEISPPLRTDELEDYKEDGRGCSFLPSDKIPKGAPKSHWWWHETLIKRVYPDENEKGAIVPSNPTDPASPPNIVSDKEKYRKALVEQLEIIKEWGKLSINEQPVCVVYFIEKIGELFLEYYQDHLGEAQDYARPYQTILKENYRLIERFYVNEVASKVRNADFEWDDPWNRACLYWTNLEAFNAMFDGVSAPLRKDELEEYMEGSRGCCYLHINEIPKRVPKSHWWWFDTLLDRIYPNDK